MKGTLELQILKEVNPEIKIGVEGVDPKEYFVKRDGLYVSEYFAEQVLPKAEKIGQQHLVIESLEVATRSSEEIIEKALGGSDKHIFDESTVCALIAEMISKQSSGEDGLMLTDGNANIFYTASCVVFVGWGSMVRSWRVRAWERDSSGWPAGDRVFSPVSDRVAVSSAL